MDVTYRTVLETRRKQVHVLKLSWCRLLYGESSIRQKILKQEQPKRDTDQFHRDFSGAVSTALISSLQGFLDVVDKEPGTAVSTDRK